MLSGVADKVPDYKEIAWKLHLLDDGDLARQTLLIFRKSMLQLPASRECGESLSIRLRKTLARDMSPSSYRRVNIASRHVEVRKWIAHFR